MRHDHALEITKVWEEAEELNPFARTYTSICRAMKAVNDPDQYARGVEALLSGLPRQLEDLLAMIHLSGDAMANLAGVEPPPDPLEDLSKKSADPFELLASMTEGNELPETS